MALTSWATHVLQWQLQRGARPRGRANLEKLSQEYMKLESLVIADQHAAVNTFPGLVHTARHAMGVGSA